MEEQELNSENDVITEPEAQAPEANSSDIILEVKDLKKFFLTKKEWKLVKEPVGVQPEGENEGAEQSEQADNAELDAPIEEAPTAESEQNAAQPAKKFKYKLVHKKTYVRAVSGVSFDMKYGETLGIVGESGCGKSTMGRSILRLHPITSGNVIFEGTDITQLKPSELRKFRTKMQIIFQDPYSSLPPRSPVGQIIGEAVKVHNIVPKEEYRDYVIDIMRKCGLQDFYFDRYPHEFSGGQRQRICIARALAVKPKFVVCDEPVSALDVSIQAQVINLLKDLQREMNLTYLFISHDLSVVQHISDRVGVMYLGSFVELGDKKEIFDNPMHPYTLALLSAVPVPDPHYKGNRIILHGDIPSPANPPKGCKFHTRCSKCMEICKHVEPKFKDYGNGHMCACHLYPQD
ncbi:MAG: ATP-binding cassette domain-containing protein [Clostridiales bacterium]|nr:ATP-binding cassette domain-containing protein [Clostridiales bacterium]